MAATSRAEMEYPRKRISVENHIKTDSIQNWLEKGQLSAIWRQRVLLRSCTPGLASRNHPNESQQHSLRSHLLGRRGGS